MIEVMVAVGILGAIIGIGWGSIQDHLPRFRLVRVAKQFRSDLSTMRQIAVQTNRESKVKLLSNAGNCTDVNLWGGSWELSIGDQALGSRMWDLLPEDSAEDGRDDDQSLAVQYLANTAVGGAGAIAGMDVCFQQWSRLTGPSYGANNQDSVVFSPRGWLRNPPADFNSRGYMEFLFVNQEAQRQGVFDAVRVQVTRAGMIRLLRAPQPYNLNQVGTSESSSTL